MMKVDKLYIITCYARVNCNVAPNVHANTQLKLSAQGLRIKYEHKTTDKNLIELTVSEVPEAKKKMDGRVDYVVGVYFCAHGPLNSTLSAEHVAAIINEHVTETPQKVCFDVCYVGPVHLKLFVAAYAKLRDFERNPPTKFAAAAYDSFVSVYHTNKLNQGSEDDKKMAAKLIANARNKKLLHAASEPNDGQKFFVNGNHKHACLMSGHYPAEVENYKNMPQFEKQNIKALVEKPIRETYKHFAKWHDGKVIPYRYDGDAEWKSFNVLRS